MPYEKLETYGEKNLKISELLAIIIKTGTKKKTALDISCEILNLGKDEKNLNFLDEISLKDLKKIEGIGRVKAIQIKAVVELAKRINKSTKTYRVKIKNTKDVLDIFMEELRYEKQENLKLVILNLKNEIIKIVNVVKGNTSSVFFDVKNILSEPVKLEAQRIILIHNHPSGDPTPSKADIEATKTIKQAASLLGIELLEHIIIGDGIYQTIR